MICFVRFDVISQNKLAELMRIFYWNRWTMRRTRDTLYFFFGIRLRVPFIRLVIVVCCWKEWQTLISVAKDLLGVPGWELELNCVYIRGWKYITGIMNVSPAVFTNKLRGITIKSISMLQTRERNCECIFTAQHEMSCQTK